MYGWFTIENGVYPDRGYEAADILDGRRPDKQRGSCRDRFSDEAYPGVCDSNPEKDWTLDPQ